MVTEKTSDKNGAPLEVLGVGMAESNGLRYGYIVNRVDVTRSLKKAVEQAEKTSGIKIKSARLGIGGVTLESAYSSGSTIISRADSEITDLDLEKAIKQTVQEIEKCTNGKVSEMEIIEWLLCSLFEKQVSSTQN